MRPGILYLAELGLVSVDRSQIELEAVSCLHCGKNFRLFTPKAWKEEDGVTDLGWDIQTRDLRERAQRAIDLDCPNAAPEGQPKRSAHPTRITLLESGAYGV